MLIGTTNAAAVAVEEEALHPRLTGGLDRARASPGPRNGFHNFKLLPIKSITAYVTTWNSQKNGKD